MRFLRLDENNPPKNYNDELACIFFKILFESPLLVSSIDDHGLAGHKNSVLIVPGTSNASNWSETPT